MQFTSKESSRKFYVLRTRIILRKIIENVYIYMYTILNKIRK